jgi:hypothetical protein
LEEDSAFWEVKGLDTKQQSKSSRRRRGRLFPKILESLVTKASKQIPASDSITSVGVCVCSDSQGQISLSSINWGNAASGGSVTTAIFVKNSGNTPITLYLSSANWTPSGMGSSLTLTWDYNNATIQPGSLMKVNLTLAASQNAPQGQSFAVNIIITATG